MNRSVKRPPLPLLGGGEGEDAEAVRGSWVIPGFKARTVLLSAKFLPGLLFQSFERGRGRNGRDRTKFGYTST